MCTPGRCQREAISACSCIQLSHLALTLSGRSSQPEYFLRMPVVSRRRILTVEWQTDQSALPPAHCYTFPRANRIAQHAKSITSMLFRFQEHFSAGWLPCQLPCSHSTGALPLNIAFGLGLWWQGSTLIWPLLGYRVAVLMPSPDESLLIPGHPWDYSVLISTADSSTLRPSQDVLFPWQSLLYPAAP